MIMINVDLQQLIRTLAAQTRYDLERSAERCVARGGREVLVEDLLLALLEHADGVLVQALADAGVQLSELESTLYPKSEHSATRNPVFATTLVHWLQQGLMVAHVELGQPEVDQGALLLALLRHPLEHAGSAYQKVLSRLDIERVRSFLQSNPPQAHTPAADSLLQRFTHDLTHQAREGLIDPVLCRDAEIRQLVDILTRRRKNNPILIGEAGVGKTAIVEGFALQVVASRVPPSLQQVRVLTLDLGLLQAGAGIKGEFERRLKGVIDEVNASPQRVILFIDEAHTLVGTGGQGGASDSANLLKPALARGELRTIAATTWSEYKKHIEKDPALARRFQPIRVGEPGVEQAVSILRGLVPVYEASHGVYVRDDAVVAAAHMSARYLAGRQLPDKAVDVLDTACARARTHLAVPLKRCSVQAPNWPKAVSISMRCAATLMPVCPSTDPCCKHCNRGSRLLSASTRRWNRPGLHNVSNHPNSPRFAHAWWLRSSAHGPAFPPSNWCLNTATRSWVLPMRCAHAFLARITRCRRSTVACAPWRQG